MTETPQGATSAGSLLAARPALRAALDAELAGLGAPADQTEPRLRACLDAIDGAEAAELAGAELAGRLQLIGVALEDALAQLASYRRLCAELAAEAFEAGLPGARALLRRTLGVLEAAGQAICSAEAQRLRRFEMLADNSVDGVIISGLDGAVRYVNPAMAKLVGFASPAAMLEQQRKFDENDPARREFLENVLPVLLERGYLRWDAEPVSQQGALTYTENIGFLLRDAAGRPVGTAGFVRDVSAERIAQNERDQMREEMIRVQQSALRELSTPLIPISDTIVVMPLIGNIDAGRAQQLIEALLFGVVERQAETAIIDITGVPIVDTQVADALLRAARAVGLVGAQVILTGVRPEVAQTLVGLGAELGTLATQSSLQAGIAYAMGSRR